MNHYGIAQWVDFARGLVPQETRMEMQDHLAAGCTDCQKSLYFCDKLARICRQMGTDAVPDYAVRNVRAMFPASAPKTPKRAFRIPIQLIYDSFLVPVPAGLRSTWQVGWQGLFHAGDCSVDLRVDPNYDPPRPP